MNITTKYNIGDTVWTVKDNKAYSFEVTRISIIITESVLIIYENSGKNYIERYDKNVFGSREELINLL